MRRSMQAALAAIGFVTLTQSAAAQALGPQRQFLAIEPYYEHTQLDDGPGQAKISLHGYGARLWINLDPFHFIPSSSIALFTSYTPKQNQAVNGDATALSYGAEYDQFLMRRPIAGFLDPFLSLGGSAYRVKSKQFNFTQTYGTLIPGGGIRVPLPNRFELRGDVKDMILFNADRNPDGSARRTNNLVLQAALGVTF